MVRGLDIPWVGAKIPLVAVRNTMGRGFNMQWVGGQNIMGGGGGQNTMGRGFDIPYVVESKYHRWGFNIPWIGVRYTMGRGFKIPWVGRSIYHG